MRTLLSRALPALVIILLAGLGGFFAYRLAGPFTGRFIGRSIGGPGERPLMASASPPEAAAGQAVGSEVAASAPASASSGRRSSVIPDTLPDVAFADRAGVMRRFSDWKGQPLLVNFWATWCAPCLEEIPMLERLSRESRRDRLQIIGVAVDSRAAVLEYARREAIPYPLLIGEQSGLEVIRALGMQTVFPFSVFVDARGRIITVKIGELRDDQAKLILDRVDDLDRGMIDLATARSEIAHGIANLAIAHAHDAAGAGSDP